ncbi:uridine 5'-monophosphate synthase [Neodiprion fabricii]|uniref:uridine 5'-monophosphate synthase n=1 Tax=Neodiprion fabricii TaxID=2872261 RepID=UPI001ED97E65|nr:uridine 5'-monophosphate synthase [Neodiprion fabricii]
MENRLAELAVELFEINAVKFGSFVTKAGRPTPVCFDLKVIISHPRLMKSVSTLLWTLAENGKSASQICGMPYTALPIAALISAQSNIPLLIRRKETKSYRTKKIIEGQFKEGENCIIIEDIVTTGSSVLEAVKDLTDVGLKVEEAVVILDRQQGGDHNLSAEGIRMRSLYSLTSLMQYLLNAGKVTSAIVQDVKSYVEQSKDQLNSEGNSVSRLRIDFASRAKLAKNPAAAKLFNIMSAKKSTLCLAVDLTKADEVLDLAELAGPHIAVLKTHIDLLEDFTSEFIDKLKQLSKEHNFLIMEDRKFADIGHTVSLQYRNGVYKIAEWADFVTAHTVPGSSIVSGLQDGLKGIKESRGIFLVAEMSSEGALTIGEYVKHSVLMSETSNLVAGLVCQYNVFDDPGLIQLTPGIRLEKSRDDLGQQYKTPQMVINAGADLAVVGRGVTAAQDKLSAIIQYKEKLWQAYSERISN